MIILKNGTTTKEAASTMTTTKHAQYFSTFHRSMLLLLSSALVGNTDAFVPHHQTTPILYNCANDVHKISLTPHYVINKHKFHKTPPVRTRSIGTPLRVSPDDDNDTENKTPPPPRNASSSSSTKEKEGTLSSYLTIQNRLLLNGDLLTLLLIALLLGFTDAVTDPSFYPNGGFNQPVPAVPNTLGVLFERLSVMDVAWVLSAIKNKGYSWSATVDVESTWKCGLTIWLDYCSLRILFGILLAVLGAGGKESVDGLDLLRQCWFSLGMVGWRIIYGRYFRERL